jgi:hypothetical protein
MAENKTRQTDASVAEFLGSVAEDRKRRDSQVILEMMREESGEQPRMWGESIVGFGSYHYKYESGREGDMPIIGFSPRKQNLTLYLVPGFDAYGSLLERLGKHTTGKVCLYIKKLEDVDLDVLRELVRLSVEHMRAANP